MDAAEYLPMFLAEGRERLQELNLAVVQVEEQPDDQATIDAIFRIAHSMKGMSATMGFAGMAALTHEMEDVFELLRQRAGGLGREAFDVLLECLDALSAATDAIEATGAEEIEPAPLVERLRGLVRDRTPEQETERHGSGVAPANLAELAGDARVVHVSATLAADCSMPSVRAYMVLSVLGELGEAVACSPAPDDVETFAGTQVDAWLVTDADEAALSAAAGAVPEVAEAFAVQVNGEEGPVADPAVAEQAIREAVPAVAAPADPKPARTPSKGATTVCVDAERLDQLMHFMGELVLHRTTVEALASGADVPGLTQAMQDLTRASQALQAMVMQVRMIPVEAVFLRFPRLVRDLQTKLGKDVELRLVGKETELDRTVVDALGDPLVHLVRNALDHGLEGPEERVAAGKPATGVLEIGARHAGGNVVITVTDDGRGIDPARVARKAAERGLIAEDAVATVDAARAVELLFHPGFSTAEDVSDISGRGVGMDAVRSSIRELGGEVLLSSEHGAGTTAQIRLPLTLAIMAALLVEVGGKPFAIPLDRIERTLRLADHVVRSVAGSRMLVMDDGVLPLVDASARLNGAPAPEATHAVVVLGVEPGSEYAPSALGEVGNIVGSSYINALAEMTGMAIEPTPPATATDMLGAIVESVLATQAHAGDIALMLDSELAVEGSDCSIAFMLVPSEDGVGELLERLGLG